MGWRNICGRGIWKEDELFIYPGLELLNDDRGELASQQISPTHNSAVQDTVWGGVFTTFATVDWPIRLKTCC